jgi:thiol-disulfide isomerase/thioredoxin
VLVAALVAAVAGGGAWRVRNGRMRDTLKVSGAGQARGVAGAKRSPEDVSKSPDLRLTSEQIGHPLGARATLLQFSSAFCAPCRATRRILADVAGFVPGVAHVEIDAESRLDLVRQFGVLRTPTVLVLAADGGVVRRASGQPRKADVIAAVGAAVGPGFDQTAAIAPDPGA